MKILRFDSVGGAAGDMILAALHGLGAKLKIIEQVLNDAIGGDEFVIETAPHSEAGLNGLKLQVRITKESGKQRSLDDIYAIIERAAMPDQAKKLAHAVFEHLAAAEAKVHGCHPRHIHFHEVGAVDSIVDILGSCFAFAQLGIDFISFGALPTGTGTFHCRHGIYPLPAPATLQLLAGVRIVRTDEPFELVTPTGAALLTAFPGGQDRAAAGKVLASAHAFGSRKLKSRPNVLRVTLLESAAASEWNEENCTELETNLDDVTPELAGALSAKLFERGALDVWTIPCLMKKQRGAFALRVLCRNGDADAFCRLIFTETGTLGIRIAERKRRVLERQTVDVEIAPDCRVRVKLALMNGKVVGAKPEYEDCLRVSAARGLTWAEVARRTLDAWKKC